ncbi:MAG: YkgJ family cysteine cluster protein [Deltaproteobacteria bacterium]|nr:YkgJ family cysteine cluster protein [Deltaproteobacteria bacterium]
MTCAASARPGCPVWGGAAARVEGGVGRRARAAARVGQAPDEGAQDGLQVGVFDCERCGACCVNTDENQGEGYPWYVEVDDPRSALLRVLALRATFVVADPRGRPHLRLGAGGRCCALEGALGAAVRCAVYEHRPAGCRKVTAGDAACRRARAERGLVPWGAEAAGRR